MENDLNWQGHYATKNGEFFINTLGYWLDYYEPSKQIIIEYNENNHKYYNKKKMKIREKEIKQELNCKFIKIKECKKYETFIDRLKKQLK